MEDYKYATDLKTMIYTKSKCSSGLILDSMEGVLEAT
jgi:hypothetical protein